MLHADGRPLYQYRCTDHEFGELELMARSAAQRMKARGYRTLDVSALFCLFASEWWRRNYRGGPWRWKEILDAVGIEDLPYVELQNVVSLGLKIWKRPLLVLGSGRAFLVTLACEGGLPLQVLHHEGTKLRSFFKHLLEDMSRYRNAGLPPAELSRQLQDHLPSSLRRDHVFHLSGQLVEGILQLQGLIPDGVEPVAYLDQHVPNWRDKLPVNLDNSLADKFLGNLMQDAVSAANRSPAKMKLVRLLVTSGDNWLLRGRFELPKVLRNEELQASLSEELTNLGSRFELEYSFGETTRFTLGWGTRRTAGDFLIEEAKTGCCLQKSTADRVNLYIRNSRYCYHLSGVPGTEAMLDLPWVFQDENDQPGELIGQGSVRSRHPVLWVAANSNTEPMPEKGSQCELVGLLHEEDRFLYKLHGAARFSDDDGIYCTIASTNEKEQQYNYQFSGAMSDLGDRLVYLGIPNCMRNNGPMTHRIQQSVLEWRPLNPPGEWRTFDNSCYGEGLVRHVENGELLHRSRIAIVPRSTKVEFSSTGSASNGSIILSGTGNILLSMDLQDGMRGDIQQEGVLQRYRLDLSCTGLPPSAVPVAIRWQERGSLSARLPFPAKGVRIYQHDGSALPHGASITCDHLAELTIQTLSPTGQDRFILWGEVRSAAIPVNIAQALWFRRQLRDHQDNNQFNQFTLQNLIPQIRMLLAATSDLDAKVEVYFEHNGQRLDNCFSVHRYDLSFDPDYERGIVALAKDSMEKLGTPELEQLVVAMVPLWKPDQSPLKLDEIRSEGVHTGQWQIPLGKLEEGPWFVLGRINDWHAIRPTLWAVTLPSDEEKSLAADPKGNSLQEAIRIPDPTQREQALSQVIERFVQQPDNADGELLKDMMEAFESLPPSAIDLFPILARYPEAMVMALFHGNPLKLEQRILWFEQLPLLWVTVPLRKWVNGAERCHDHYIQMFAETDNPLQMAKTVMDTYINKLPTQPMYWELVKEVLNRVVNGTWTAQSKNQLASACPQYFVDHLQAAKDELIRNRRNDEWPRANGLGTWWNSLQTSHPELMKWKLTTEQGTGYRKPLLNAPGAAAISAIHGIDLSDLQVMELKSLEQFDPHWFEEAYTNLFVLILAEYLKDHPELLER